jgi:hypothetical protein
VKAKRRITAAAAAFVAAVNFNGCAYGPPPESIYDNINSDNGISVSDDSGIETMTGEDALDSSDDFDPENNINEEVYGPPEDFGMESGE